MSARERFSRRSSERRRALLERYHEDVEFVDAPAVEAVIASPTGGDRLSRRMGLGSRGRRLVGRSMGGQRGQEGDGGEGGARDRERVRGIARAGLMGQGQVQRAERGDADGAADLQRGGADAADVGCVAGIYDVGDVCEQCADVRARRRLPGARRRVRVDQRRIVRRPPW
jgi:hypothetical protein